MHGLIIIQKAVFYVDEYKILNNITAFNLVEENHLFPVFSNLHYLTFILNR